MKPQNNMQILFPRREGATALPSPVLALMNRGSNLKFDVPVCFLGLLSH